MLYYLNDSFSDENWEQHTARLPLFRRPSDWPTRAPLTNILGWVLMPNHFHLILEETEDQGVSSFMKKLCVSMTMHFNLKYSEKGSIFQGAYKSRTVDTDEYFMQLAPYVMVKNVFELYRGGLTTAMKEFDKAWKWGVHLYPYSSLPEYAGVRNFPITSELTRYFESVSQFRTLAREMMFGRVSDSIARVALEEDEESSKV